MVAELHEFPRIMAAMWRLPVRLAWLALLPLACTGTQQQPLVLGALAASDPVEQAVRLAVAQANGAGGVNGQSVELVLEDPGDTSASARAAVGRLAEAGVVAVVGTGSPAADRLVAEAVALRGMVHVVPYNYDPTFDPPEPFFRLTPSTALEGEALAELLEEDMMEETAILTPGDPLAQAVADRFSEAFTADGRMVVGRRSYGAGQDRQALLQALEEMQPVSVVCVCSPEPAADLLQAAFQRGLLGRPWYYTGRMQDDGLPELAFPDDPGRLAGQKGVALERSSGPGFERFAAAYREQFERPPGPVAAHAYDAALLLILAAEAGGTGRGAIEQALVPASAEGVPCVGLDCLAAAQQGTSEESNFDYVGASGSLDLDQDGTLAAVPLAVWQYTLGGDVELLDRLHFRP